MALEGTLAVTGRIRIPMTEFEVTYVRSAGPGGQNVNKVSSKAVLRWNVTATQALSDEVKTRFTSRYGSRLTTEGDLLLTSQKYRDQAKNLDDCLERLKGLIQAVSVAPKVRRPTKPSKASQERRHTEKKVRSQRKANRRVPGRNED